MIKRLRIFLCLILAIVMPFCFVACKSGGNSTTQTPSGGSSSGGSSGEQSGGQSGGTGGEQGGGTSETPPVEPPAVTYVLDEAEMNRVLSSSYDVCKDFIVDLNESELLKNNDYSSALGAKTEPILEYVFYPARFVKEHSSDFKNQRIYALQPRFEQTTFKYFEIEVSQNNDKIFATIMVNTTSTFTAYLYEYSILNGVIKSLKLSYLCAGYGTSSSLDFAEVMLDFENSTFELGYGKLLEITSRTYLETKFNTKEGFSGISSNKWSYSHYQKINFGGAGSFTKETTSMPNNVKMVEMYDKFGFIDAFEKLEDFQQVPYSEIINLNSNDYFALVDAEGLIGYDSTNCVFEISEGE